MKREYWKHFPFVFTYLRRYKVLTAWSIVLTIMAALAALLEPWPLAVIVDGVLGQKPAPWIATTIAGESDTALIIFAVLAGFLITLIVQGLAVLSNYVNTRIIQRTALDFRSDLFAHCQTLSQSYHDELATGDFMYRINMEAHAVGEMSVALIPLAQSVLTLLGMFIVAFRIDPTLALLSLTVVPFVYYSTGYYGRKIEPRQIEVRGLEVKSMTIVNEVMGLLRVVCAFGRERHEYDRFRAQGEQAVSSRINLTVRQTLFNLGVALTTAAGTALVLGVGAHSVLTGELSAGELLVIIAYIAAVYQPLQTISATLARFQEHLISIKYAKLLMDVPPAVVERADAMDIDRLRGGISFENVDFAYHGRARALEQVTFRVPAGSVVAVVGPTGAGKSTLVSLIPRFLDADSGRVCIDGIDVRDLTIDSLRRQVAFVHQEPMLFARTIEENIRYGGDVHATFDDVTAAARAANAHDFIVELPEGYATMLGERGAGLSGGERQRIAVARAFLRDAPILILDEPTASIDSATEAVILDALDRLSVGRTTLIVAHRLSTIRSADHVLVLEDGRIIEQGVPEELLRSEGLYARLHELQTLSRGAVTAGPLL